MTANASIVIAERSNVLRIPNAALRFRPPEGAKVKGGTNALAAAAGRTNMPMMAAAGDAPPGEGRPNREEMRRRFESMSPEEREQMRERMRARFGEGGPPGAGGRGMFGARAGQDAPTTRTVYLIDKEAAPDKAKPAGIAGLVPGLPGAAKANPQLRPVTIKTGISDGSFTEVLEGLREGDVVVTGLDLPAAATTLGPPMGAPPFGGPPFRGGMRR
jgi:HlyD family secretion protein